MDPAPLDQLLGSQSRLWLSDLQNRAPAAGADGLFVDLYFPVGELEVQPGVQWRRPGVRSGTGVNWVI